MADLILTLNAGSSSLKAALYALRDGQAGSRVARFHLSGIGSRPELRVESVASRQRREVDADSTDMAWPLLLDAIIDVAGERRIPAVGHRVVHGGRDYAAPVEVTPEIRTALESLTPLAPLHEPYNLAGIDHVAAQWPQARQIACFDTAFHRQQPAVAQRYALPYRYFDEGVLRYGFHGLSCEYIAGRLPVLLGRAETGRVIVAHLGSGVSMCAMRDGESCATTMGFTALAGLPMSTRSGDIDPGILLFLQEVEGMSPVEVAHLLHKQSGLLGLSGLSGDMRTLEDSREPRAAEAIAHFVYRCQREIGSLAAALGGLDALVFTAGIGENSALIREQITAGLDWLGCSIDAARNAQNGPEISKPGSRATVWTIPTDEEAMLAQHAARHLHISIT